MEFIIVIVKKIYEYSYSYKFMRYQKMLIYFNFLETKLNEYFETHKMNKVIVRRSKSSPAIMYRKLTM